MANSDNKINIGGVWKDMNNIQINIGGAWKTASEAYINIGGAWKQFWSGAPTTIGQLFQGGYYFGTIAVGSITYSLLCAPIGGQTKAKWKTNYDPTPGTTSLVDGVANTTSMITAGASLHPAANFCKNLTIGGYNDWYLPAKDELNLLYQNHSALETAGAGSFIDNFYWSSTEHSNISFAWAQSLQSGSTSSGAKIITGDVRAVRRVAV